MSTPRRLCDSSLDVSGECDHPVTVTQPVAVGGYDLKTDRWRNVYITDQPVTVCLECRQITTPQEDA